MSGKGAPLGNNYAAKSKMWSNAIKRALERRNPKESRTEAIDELADKLIDQCLTGDLAALREFGDRVEGKPAQAIVGDSEGDPIKTLAEIVIRNVDASKG